MRDRATGKTFEGTVDRESTLGRIEKREVFLHRDDDSIFSNRSGALPERPPGYYREFVHPTPGVDGPGPQRVVIGEQGEIYYSPDHYHSFVRINP